LAAINAGSAASRDREATGARIQPKFDENALVRIAFFGRLLTPRELEGSSRTPG
jgi:hypothetical protein